MELGSLGLNSLVLQELRMRALHLVRSSRDPKRCLQVMRARVAAFSDSGSLGGVSREKFEEEGRGCVVPCLVDGYVGESAPVSVQMPLSEDELFEEGYNDLKGLKMMNEVKAQDLEKIQNGEFTDGQVGQAETQDMKEMVSEEFQFYAVQMHSSGQSFLSCAIQGHINLQSNTTQKVKMKKCITQRVKMKMSFVVAMLAIDKLVVWQELALLLYTDSIQLRMNLSEKESAKLAYFCFLCGLLGLAELYCPSPAERDALGRLPFRESLSWAGNRRSWNNGTKRNQGGQYDVYTYTEAGRADDVEDGEEATSPIKPGQGVVRDVVYKFNARGGLASRGGFRNRGKGRNNNQVYKTVDMNAKGGVGTSQLMLLDQDDLNKKRNNDGELSNDTEDSRDSKKKRAAENSSAATAEQSRREQ